MDRLVHLVHLEASKPQANLNRMSASPGATYTNDLSGNRLTKTVGSVTNNYTWDSLNRLTKTTVGGGYVGNLYRPDGLLHRKIVRK